MKIDKRADAFCRAVVQELIRLRRESGMSQNQLSTPAGLHQTAVNLLESGKRSPSLATLYCLAEALGTTPVKVMAAAQRSMSRASVEACPDCEATPKPATKRSSTKNAPKKSAGRTKQPQSE